MMDAMFEIPASKRKTFRVKLDYAKERVEALKVA